MRWSLAACIAGALLVAGAARAADELGGKAAYDSACAACHGSGAAGAPKLGDVAAWRPRIATGLQALVNSTRAGKGAMPPKGGNAALTEEQLVGAVLYMIGQSRGATAAPTKTAAASAPAKVAAARAPVTAPKDKPVAATPVVVPAQAPAQAPTQAPAQAPTQAVAAAAPVVPAPGPAASAVIAAATGGANAFNRLLRPNARNLPPAEDLIHDPSNDGTLALQPPLAAFGALPRSNSGNRVDWVKALAEGKIAPRADRLDAKAVAAVMDLNIVREVKGSMPDVVYPHKQHTEWLDCSNCHPAIFKPQKGANQISMAAILLGQSCGVCHGKVAFPVSECRLCHSKAKPTATAGAASGAAQK